MSTKTARRHMHNRTNQDPNSQMSFQEAVDGGSLQSVTEYVRDCVRANPEAAALWCFGIGFVLGWKIKPW